jgi:hypothetical protein
MPWKSTVKTHNTEALKLFLELVIVNGNHKQTKASKQKNLFSNTVKHKFTYLFLFLSIEPWAFWMLNMCSMLNIQLNTLLKLTYYQGSFLNFMKCCFFSLLHHCFPFFAIQSTILYDILICFAMFNPSHSVLPP